MTTTIEINSFAVKTEVFEGPLDLLLDLVEKRKLLINDISLAEVTDEYMRQVSEMQEASLPGTAQFVALAATLLLIKSKSLLPVLDLTDEEEESIEGLEERLKLYQIYRNAGKTIEDTYGTAVSHPRQFVSKSEPIFTTDKFTELTELTDAMYRVLSELPKKVEKPKVRVRKVVSLEEMMDRLKQRIENQLKLRFSELINNEQEKTTVIVGFLAILESVKQGSVLVAQADRFQDIEIEREGFSTPKYY
ncbi:segregation/condensation protein A [Candidatus Pacebacteria bacterium]|nr:segregation/condensation protein A [Candidatus Paceibacterota bacterium]